MGGLGGRLGRGFAALALALAVSPALAGEPDSCRTVRFSDIGWTDLAATTAVSSRILLGLGYTPKTLILSVPVTFRSLKNKDIDVFLGNWMPTEEAERQPYIEDGSIDIVRPNLLGAKLTLAVPAETWDLGLHDFADLGKFADKLDHKIYGIESGAEANRTISDMIAAGKFGLAGFELVESSEQGMLAQLDRAVRRHQPMVFLGLEPHPMNVKFKIRYLDDPTNVFGPDDGAARVDTDVRGGYLSECPNVGAFVKNLVFTVAIEDEWMAAILFDHGEAPAVTEAWLKAHPADWAPWLDGVTTFDGKPGLAAVRASLGIAP
jgi:glycine betaine/proline transport system substrate-binding protein